MKRIGILGIGGIGGFVGAALAQTYKDSPNIEVVFICRGDTKKEIETNGLTLESKGNKLRVHPDLVSDNPNDIGEIDVLIIATKSYSLTKVVIEYEQIIREHTVVIPLQNMVNAGEVIRSVLPDKGKVLEGCIYVASNVKSPGNIVHVGGPGKVIIGGEKREGIAIAELLQQGGVDITYDENIKEALWSKYLFVAPVSAITAAYEITFGELRENEELLPLLKSMMKEIKGLALKSNVQLSDEVIENSLTLLHKFPFEAKTSMQLDFEKGWQTEEEFLVDYIVTEGKQKKVAVVNYESVQKKLVSK